MAAYVVDNLLATNPTWGIRWCVAPPPGYAPTFTPRPARISSPPRHPLGTRAPGAGSSAPSSMCSTADQQRRQLIELMADPAIRIVSLTVTEKGYLLPRYQATGALDEAHPDVARDLRTPR